jgi:hypothetical protein
MSSSYEIVRGSKLTFKGGLGIDKKISKKWKKKKRQEKDELLHENAEGGEVSVINSTDPVSEIDTGTGHAPDGKKSKKYEELFPVETKRHGYVVPPVESRSAALDERVKKKADRYCK